MLSVCYVFGRKLLMFAFPFLMMWKMIEVAFILCEKSFDKAIKLA